MLNLCLGFFVPFLGTVLGAAMVFFMREKLSAKFEQTLIGFAGGVMLAASIWSLILPALDQTTLPQHIMWVPTTIGILLGVGFLLLVDVLSAKLNKSDKTGETKPKTSSKMLLAITIHNIPEGLAVGVALAGAFYNNNSISFAGALTLAIGIAIQNFPDGAIVSMPLCMDGASKKRAFWLGVMSGAMELLSAVVAFFLTELLAFILPYVLAFAAGATIYVVVKDLIPSSQVGENVNLATIAFILGFIIMFVLDVALA